jgi:hypothetical protein
MGDAQRLGRINTRILEINAMIAVITEQKYNVQFEMNESNAQGDDFIDYIQEIAELDQTIWDLKVEKQRLIDLI